MTNLPQIRCARCPGYRSLLNKLHIIFDDVLDDNSYLVSDPEEHTTFWVGTEITASHAIQAMTIARKQWSRLVFIDLTDRHPNRIYIGGVVSKDKAHLRKWSEDDFEHLSLDWSRDELHRYIRTRT